MTRLTARCPVCGVTVDRRQGSPGRKSHIVIMYPCEHWTTVEAAEGVARNYQNLMRQLQQQGATP